MKLIRILVVGLLLFLMGGKCLGNPDSLRWVAVHNLYQGNYDKALEIYDEIIPQFYEKEDYYQYIKSYIGIFYAYKRQKKFDEILTLGLPKAQEAEKLLGAQDSTVSELYYYIGNSYYSLNNYGESDKFYKKAEVIQVYHHLTPLLISTYSGLTTTSRKRGDYEATIDYLYKLIFLFETRKLPQSKTYAALLKIGNAHVSLKDFETAIAIYEELYPKLINESNPWLLSLLYNEYAIMYIKMKRYEQAIAFYEKRIKLNKKYKYSLTATYSGIGFTLIKQKKYRNALKYINLAIKTYGKLEKKNNRNARSYSNLGASYTGLQKYDSALYHLQRSLINFLPTFNDSSIYVNPSLEYTNSEDALLYPFVRKGIAFVGKALETKEEKDRKMAVDTFWKSIQLIDKMRQQFEAQGSKSSLANRTWWVFEAAIKGCLDLYQATGDPKYQAYAFQFAEKSKAVLVQDAVAESAAQQHVALPDSVLDYEHNLKVDITYLENELFQAEKRKKEEKANEVRTKLLSKREELRQLALRLAEEYPSYHELKYKDQRKGLADIQASLAADQAMIAYFVGDEQSYVFTITQNSLHIQPLEVDGEELEELVKKMRDSLDPRQQEVGKSSYQSFVQTAYAVQQLVLDRTLDQLPEHIQQLTFVPDGLLSYIPFEVLLTEPADLEVPDYRAPAYLIKKYEINYAYSASLLHSKLQGLNHPSENGVLAFAPSYPKSITDSAEIAQLGQFRDQISDLKWNGQEVEQIGEYLPTVSFTAQDATESRFKELASKYRIIHLAMHALVDDDNPMQSRLVFTKTDSDQDDSYLNAYELYNMDLNADLAILSACNTGYGKYIRGEGLVSLGRAFAYAGCPSVVISHWSADDEATSELMKRFYKNLSEGLNKSEAMRQAKLDYFQNTGPHRANPMYWGSFVLIGDESPVVSNSLSWWMVLLGLALLVSVVGLVRRFFLRI